MFRLFNQLVLHWASGPTFPSCACDLILFCKCFQRIEISNTKYLVHDEQFALTCDKQCQPLVTRNCLLEILTQYLTQNFGYVPLLHIFDHVFFLMLWYFVFLRQYSINILVCDTKLMSFDLYSKSTYLWLKVCITKMIVITPSVSGQKAQLPLAPRPISKLTHTH